ncbi:MAG: PKD domain-containing protein, partial [Vicingaceae bacterium]
INTKYNEMFPFLSSNKIMYFSSDKPYGKGGLDVYESSGEFESWSTPIALDSSINSSYDDFSLIFNSKNTEGYFSSNRNGSDDIFKINVNFPTFKNCEEILEVQLCYEFFEEATINVDSISMVYEWDFGDGDREEGTEVRHCYEKPGHYQVALNIKDPLIDEVFVNQDIYDLEIEAVSHPEISFPDSIPVDSLFKITVKQGGWKDYLIDAYYIDYGDSYIQKNHTKLHKYSSTGIVEVKVLISGTDKETGEIQTNCFYKLINVIDDDYI